MWAGYGTKLGAHINIEGPTYFISESLDFPYMTLRVGEINTAQTRFEP